MRSARLCGRDHAVLGAVDALAEGPAAIALSMGGAPKAYDHTDPNEDAAAFAAGTGGWLVAVADAHLGCAASQVAIDFVLERAAAWLADAGPVPGSWPEEARGALWDAHMAVRRATGLPERQGSRTTLAVGLARPGEGRLFWACIGDSHLFRVTPAAVEDLTSPGRPCPPRYFLGSESLTPEELGERAVVGSGPSAGARALVLATDGISERLVGLDDPAAALAEVAAQAACAAPELRPLEAARGLALRANAAHRRNPSGDNVAVAVCWLEA